MAGTVLPELLDLSIGGKAARPGDSVPPGASHIVFRAVGAQMSARAAGGDGRGG